MPAKKRALSLYIKTFALSLPCGSPPSIDPLQFIHSCLFLFIMQNPDLLHGGIGSRSTCCHCLTLHGFGLAVAEAPVWSCFTLNIYALMPAALTHFPCTAECSARRGRFNVAGYELWVKGLLCWIFATRNTRKRHAHLNVFFLSSSSCLSPSLKKNPLITPGTKLSSVQRRNAQKCHRGFRLRQEQELQTTVAYFRFNMAKRE